MGITSLPPSICASPCEGSAGANWSVADAFFATANSPRIGWRGHSGSLKGYRTHGDGLPRNGSMRNMDHTGHWRHHDHQRHAAPQQEGAAAVDLVDAAQYRRDMLIMQGSYLASLIFCMLAFRECGGFGAVRRCVREVGKGGGALTLKSNVQ